MPRAIYSLLAGLVLFAATGCSAGDLPRLGMPTPATDQAPRVLSLWQGSWVAALGVGALVWGLIVWSVIFFRRRGDHLPPQVRYNLPVEVLYTIVPFLIVLVFFFFTARDETELLRLSKDPDHTVSVVGKRWSWDFNYLDEGVYETGTPGQPPELWLPQGETVRFQLTSPDVIHSFWVPAFLFKMDVIPGRANEFEVTPSRAGVFAGKCAELCGVDHSRMLFTVRVVSPEEYRTHVADLRARGQTGQLDGGDARSAVSRQTAGETVGRAGSATGGKQGGTP